jgi:hypothetical protein
MLSPKTHWKKAYCQKIPTESISWWRQGNNASLYTNNNYTINIPRQRVSCHLRSTYVMSFSFCDFRQFSAKNGIFLENRHFCCLNASILSQNWQFF